MKIYEMKVAPNPRRVRIFLSEKGLMDQITFEQIDISTGDNLKPEFKALSPLGKIPVLELDDGQTISETIAICRYFEELYPETPLMGTDALDKAQIEMWQRLIELYLLVPTGMCFQHLSGYFKDRMNPIEAWGEECAITVKKMLAFLDKSLAEKPYIAGDHYSIADITALVAIDFNRVNRISIEDNQTNLKRWYDSVAARASAQA